MSEETTNPASEEEKVEGAAPAAEETVSTETAPASEAAEQESSKEAPAEEAAAAPKEDKKRDIFAEILGEDEGAVKVHKAKGSKNISVGVVHVTSTFNNTLVSVTDQKGDLIGWSSAGKMGFKGSRKSTAYAAQVVSQDACRQAMSHGLKEVEVRVKGPGAGRESAVRAVAGLGIEITAINDVTPVPHNGCRPKKARRV